MFLHTIFSLPAMRDIQSNEMFLFGITIAGAALMIGFVMTGTRLWLTTDKKTPKRRSIDESFYYSHTVVWVVASLLSLTVLAKGFPPLFLLVAGCTTAAKIGSEYWKSSPAHHRALYVADRLKKK